MLQRMNRTLLYIKYNCFNQAFNFIISRALGWSNLLFVLGVDYVNACSFSVALIFNCYTVSLSEHRVAEGKSVFICINSSSFQANVTHCRLTVLSKKPNLQSDIIIYASPIWKIQDSAVIPWQNNDQVLHPLSSAVHSNLEQCNSPNIGFQWMQDEFQNEYFPDMTWYESCFSSQI